MNFLNKIFNQKQTKKVENNSISRPDNWNKTFSDLMKEMDDGIRTEIGEPETNWAHDYEQSLLYSSCKISRIRKKNGDRIR